MATTSLTLVVVAGTKTAGCETTGAARRRRSLHNHRIRDTLGEREGAAALLQRVDSASTGRRKESPVGTNTATAQRMHGIHCSLRRPTGGRGKHTLGNCAAVRKITHP